MLRSFSLSPISVERSTLAGHPSGCALIETPCPRDSAARPGYCVPAPCASLVWWNTIPNSSIPVSSIDLRMSLENQQPRDKSSSRGYCKNPWKPTAGQTTRSQRRRLAPMSSHLFYPPKNPQRRGDPATDHCPRRIEAYDWVCEVHGRSVASLGYTLSISRGRPGTPAMQGRRRRDETSDLHLHLSDSRPTAPQSSTPHPSPSPTRPDCACSTRYAIGRN